MKTIVPIMHGLSKGITLEYVVYNAVKIDISVNI